MKLDDEAYMARILLNAGAECEPGILIFDDGDSITEHEASPGKVMGISLDEGDKVMVMYHDERTLEVKVLND